LGRSLILNATFEPLGVVAHRRAIVLVLGEKAEIVERNGALYHSEHLAIEAPSVIRLRYYVRVPRRLHVAPSRKAVFLRDGHSCQYCGRPAENVDHVMPRSRGGGHTWDNVVASCRRCNGRKENRLPGEVGLKLRHPPKAPHDGFWLRLLVGQAEPEWLPYLPNGEHPRTPGPSVRAS
jgi:5-methylcytosine-specific restriction endonuclease McrA